jgi:hypothetical protein
MSHEDVMFDESTGCFFHDDDGEALEGVQIVYLDEILEVSNEEFYQLLIIGMKKYLLQCPEESDKIKKILDELLDKRRIRRVGRCPRTILYEAITLD